MASNALLELAKTLRLFTDVSDRSPIAAKACVSSSPGRSLRYRSDESLQPVLETLFERARSTYLHRRYGTHPETEMDDDVCKLGIRAGLTSPAAHREAAPGDADVSAFPAGGAHSKLVRAYEEATANVPPPNDPILLPGQLHLVAASSHGGRNGAPPSTGFGVSAERSGCQTDSYASIGMSMGHSPVKMATEYSDNGWMTWF